MKAIRQLRSDLAVGMLALGLTLWAIGFIYRTSFVTESGVRFFCLFDDAMVSMRYAWNLSHGQGLVWNPGERVEGYTNPLMTLIMTAATAAADRRLAVLLVQLAGIATLLGVAFQATRVATALTPDETPPERARLFRRLGFLSGLAYYPLDYWTLLGMEAGLLAFWLLAAVLFFLRFDDGARQRDAIGFGAAAGLAYLSRPDALVATLPLLGLLLARLARPHQRSWGRLLSAVVSYSAIPVAHLAWRFAYYGQWAPNTYWLKLGGFPLDARLANGTAFVGIFVGETWPVLALALLVTVLARQYRAAALATVPVSLLAYQVWTGGDAWTLWRLLAPGMPFVILLAARLTIVPFRPSRALEPSRGSQAPGFAALGLAIGASLIAAGAGPLDWGLTPRLRAVALIAGLAAALAVGLARRSGRTGLATTAVVLAATVIANVRFAPQITLSRTPARVGPNPDHVATALALDELLTPEATIGVLWAGTIPYFAGRRAVDFLGKADAHVARLPPHLPPGPTRWGELSWLPGHEKYDLGYSIRVRRPTYVQACRWGTEDLCAWVAAEYVTVVYRGVTLLLRRGAPEVRWEKLGGSGGVQPEAATASTVTPR
jgi:hypothetical protein